MSEEKSAVQHWAELKATLQDKVSEAYGVLAEASANAEETFQDRLKKLQGPLAVTIRECQKSAKLNVQLAQAQHQFLDSHFMTVDSAVKRATDKFAQLPNIDVKMTNADVVVVGPLLADASKMVVEALCLCWLLSAFLGHKEANAFVEGAKQELVGAVGDPGLGVVTLLKRLYAVATQSLRKDQDAAELLQSLADFDGFMSKWRQVAGVMGSGASFGHALESIDWARPGAGKGAE